jgi:hypothetical protein
MCHSIYLLYVYFVSVRGRKLNTCTKKKEEEKKEKRTRSFVRILFLMRRLRSDVRHSLTSSTGLLAAYSTVLCPRKGDAIVTRKKK